jgi:hypothetical protein
MSRMSKSGMMSDSAGESRQRLKRKLLRRDAQRGPGSHQVGGRDQPGRPGPTLRSHRKDDLGDRDVADRIQRRCRVRIRAAAGSDPESADPSKSWLHRRPEVRASRARR